MPLEPAPEQVNWLKELPRETTALVQFNAYQELDAYAQYRLASEHSVESHGGQRTHDVRIDQFLAGGEMSYRAITVDRYRNPAAAAAAFESVNAKRQAAHSDLYAILVRPNDSIPRRVKSLGLLAPLLSRILGTNRKRDIPEFAEHANSETGPVPDTVAEMRLHDQGTPFFMMNLNKYFPRARYENGADASGEVAYNRYSRHILPYLVSVGGYPDFIGNVLGLYVGNDNSPLHDNWSDFAMVYYPSRRNFLRMLTNSPGKGVYHRAAGLQRAVLMPSSDWD